MVVTYSQSDRVARVTIDRPERMNALTPEVFEELHDALRRGERESRVVVLTGAGDAFCAGADLQESVLSTEMSVEDLRRRLAMVQAITGSIRDLSVPVVTRVNGPAMGAGCDIALSGDFRVAAESAVFCESFVNVGVISGDGGAYILPRLVDEATAKEMVMLGREIPGGEAKEVGLVNETVPDEDLDNAVERYVDRLLELPPTALAQNKRLLNDSFDQQMDQAFDSAVHSMWICLQSEDYDEAQAAFREGREPQFE